MTWKPKKMPKKTADQSSLIDDEAASRAAATTQPSNAAQTSTQGKRGRDASWPSQIPALGWKDIFWRLWVEFNKDRVLLVAAGATFYLLLALFPALPTRTADALIAAAQRFAFGDLTKFGLPEAPSGGASRLKSDHIAIAADDGAIQAIKAGKIAVVSEVQSFDRDRVIMVDGKSINPDVVIAATGYSAGLNEMVGRLGVLNGKGVPLFNGVETMKDLPGLWFIGMRPGIEGYFASARAHGKAIAQKIARAT